MPSQPLHKDRSDNGTDEDDWEIVDLPRGADTTNETTSNAYVNFQLNSRFGRLSMRVTPSGKHESNARTSQPLHEHQQEQSPLFQLPTELRLNIYEMVLHVPVAGYGLKLVQSNTRTGKKTVLRLLETCRRILAEAESTFYCVNRLRITSPRFWQTVRQTRKDAITSISLLASSAAATLTELETLRRCAPNVKSIHIVRQSSTRFISPSSWRLMAPQLITELQSFRYLEEVEVSTPHIVDPTSEELVRKAELDEFDDRLRGTASARKKGLVRHDGVGSV